MLAKLDTFTRAYLECLLWSTDDESTEQGGDPLDQNYEITDIAPECIERSIAECAAFREAHADDLAEVDDGRAGHLLWLNRNGHGTGYWDEYDQIPDEDTRERLSDAAHKLGECWLYVGDDGRIYL